jgi:hypothetical protein
MLISRRALVSLPLPPRLPARFPRRRVMPTVPIGRRSSGAGRVRNGRGWIRLCSTKPARSSRARCRT